MPVQQIKFFKSIESELLPLEAEINSWIAENNARIIQIHGNIAPQTVSPSAGGGGGGARSFAPSDIFVAVLYEKD